MSNILNLVIEKKRAMDAAERVRLERAERAVTALSKALKPIEGLVNKDGNPIKVTTDFIHRHYYLKVIYKTHAHGQLSDHYTCKDVSDYSGKTLDQVIEEVSSKVAEVIDGSILQNVLKTY